MKAIVISKPKVLTTDQINSEKLRQSKKNLQKYIDAGIVERAFAIVGGGSAYIVNVNSRQDLDEGLKQNDLAHYSHIEVIEVEEKVK